MDWTTRGMGNALRFACTGGEVEGAGRSCCHSSKMDTCVLALWHDCSYQVPTLIAEMLFLTFVVPDDEAMFVGIAHLTIAVSFGPYQHRVHDNKWKHFDY